MPDRVAVDGVEFIEFAADEAGAERAVTLFHTFGFRKVGRHISKSVTLYRQGDINIVINTEREGLRTRPSSCTAIRSAHRSFGRRRAGDGRASAAPLAPSPSTSRSDQASLHIPAIRGVGGSVVLFHRANTGAGAVWDIEFESDG